MLQDAALHSSGFRPNLSPLMRLKQRATRPQPPSKHALFSTAEGTPQPPAPAEPARADPHPTNSHSKINSETGLAHSDSRNGSCVATTSETSRGRADAEGYTNDHPVVSSANAGGDANASLGTDAVMSHGDAKSVDDEGVDMEGTASVGAQLAADNMVQTEPDTSWQAEAHAVQQKQAQLLRSWQEVMKDPFALLMHLFALTQSSQQSAGSHRAASESVASAAAAAAEDRLTVFQVSGCTTSPALFV